MIVRFSRCALSAMVLVSACARDTTAPDEVNPPYVTSIAVSTSRDTVAGLVSFSVANNSGDKVALWCATVEARVRNGWQSVSSNGCSLIPSVIGPSERLSFRLQVGTGAGAARLRLPLSRVTASGSFTDDAVVIAQLP